MYSSDGSQPNILSPTTSQQQQHLQEQGFNLVEARKQIFDKFPAELRALHVYRHFYTDLDEEASQLSLQWFALLISYFCSLCRLEGRRVQYTQNGSSERFGAEFAKAHHRASVLFERVTSTYRKILSTYNVHSKIATRKKVGPKVLKETWKMDRGGGGKSWRYTAGAKCDVEQLAYEWQHAFLYALDELRFYEELVNFTIQILKKAFTDQRLQEPIVKEMVLLFRSNSFSFKHAQRLDAVNKTKKALVEAQGVDSILHNCHRLAARLVPPPEQVPLKLALLQRSPFVASSINHPLLAQLSYNRAFARQEVKPGTVHASYHVRLKGGEDSPHRRELRDLEREQRNLRVRSSPPPLSSSCATPPPPPTLPLGQMKTKNRRSNRSPQQQLHDPAAPSSSDYWERVATTRDETLFTVEVNQPMFAPSHRALSSLTPVNVVRARQRSAQHRAFSEAKDRILTRLPADSALPRLVDFDRPDKLEEEGFLLPKRLGDDVDHATAIMFGGQQEAGTSFLPLTMTVGGVLCKTSDQDPVAAAAAAAAAQQKRRLEAESALSPFSKLSRIAKRIATASAVRTNPDAHARSSQKAVDRLTATAAANSAMSERTRAYTNSDPTIFFVAPVDSETEKEDFTLFDPSDDIDAVYQQLAHGVQLSHFEVPIDIGVRYDDSGLLIAK